MIPLPTLDSGWTASGTLPPLRRRRPGRKLWPGVLALLLATALTAHAEVTRTDIQIAARTLSFVSNPLTGKVDVGILYSQASLRSVREAESLYGMLASGLRIGGLELWPVMVEVSESEGARVDLFFLTEYVAPDVLSKLNAATGKPRLCITIDIDQVRDGACTIGVRSRPKVDVFVSRSAAAASGTTFSTVFRVMITEL